MKRHLLLLSALAAATTLSAQSLTMQWTLVRNDIEPGILEAEIRLTNHTADTLTADGGWLIGYCEMGIHPCYRPGDALRETEVCASYHTLSPTADFQPLAPGETQTYRLLQRGAIIRENNQPEGAFFVASAGAQPADIDLQKTPFSSPLQWTRANNPGYADGAWTYAYNEPFCQSAEGAPSDHSSAAPSNQSSAVQTDPSPADDRTADDVRPLGLVPEPKSVTMLKGKANLSAPVVRKKAKNFPAEGYRLTLSPKKILLEASSEAGFFYGQETLARLRENGESLPALRIEDWPDMSHRGVMLDIVRNYTPQAEIRKILRVMAAYKLNVLHFHIADDEGWRLEIPGLPELTEMASRRGYTTDEHDCLYPAYCGGWNPFSSHLSPLGEVEGVSANGYLTRQDYISLVRYADSLHITVIPEIEMPGHARAAIRAMEERYRRLLAVSDSLANEYRLVDPEDTSRYSSAQHYTDDVICIARPSCYRFVEKVIAEIIAMHQEAGQPLRIMHVGGDEVAKGAWEGSPLCQKLMQEKGFETTHELKDWFLSQILAFLRPQGVKLAGWEEIAMHGKEANPAFAGDDVISWCWNSIPEWAGDEKPYLLANAGYPVVLACVGNLYIDMSYTNHEQERALHWGGYTDEHSTFDFLPYDIYRSVRYTMKREPRDIAAYDARKTVRLQPEARARLIGINGQLFAETIRSSEQLEQYLFPKVPGLAERAWNATPLSYRAARLHAIGLSYDSDSAALQAGREAFEQERLSFSNQLYRYELPRLHATFGVRFHLAQPGIILKDGQVVINCPVPGATVRYTLDGSEPTPDSPLYSHPFPLPAGAALRARAFFLGEQSNATRLLEEY